MDIRVLQQCDDWYLIHKPQGISVQDEAGETGLLNQLRQQWQEPELYLVHRLDKVTSGILLLARNMVANQALSAMFREKQVQKLYLALAQGKPQKKQGWVIGDLDKGRRGSWLLKRSKNNPARTQFVSHALQPGLRGYLLRPITGKTHQLRVALKSLSVPILGDTRYAAAAADRTYLHAYALRFTWQGREVEQVCPPEQGDWYLPDMPPAWQQPFTVLGNDPD